jgi:quercetin dioxygenase-like cupin family protein
MVSAPFVTGGGKDKHGDDHVFVTPSEVKWGPAPPALPAGAQAAVLTGDPSKAGGQYVIRAKLPDGYVVPPHWHPTDENVTILQGALIVGKGEKIERSTTSKYPKGHELTAGSYMRMPKEARHWAVAKGETIIQVHGVGPFDITYVNASDDPRNKK